jgi:quercetin dioxygenase-like cupin family protein
MKSLTSRGFRVALMTMGSVGVLIALNASPGAATSPQKFDSHLLGRGTFQSHGSLPLGQGEDIVVSQITVQPGGSSGWHSHPGGAIAIVQAGESTLYKAVGNQCEITTYTHGQSFIERPGDVVDAVNTGSVVTVIVATFPGVPVGGSPRIDRDDPGVCPGI